jgi:hypothetical protein
MPNTLKRTAASSRPRNFRHIPDLTAAGTLNLRLSRTGIALVISDDESCSGSSVRGTLTGEFNTHAEKAIDYESIKPQRLSLTLAEGKGASS